MASAGGALPPAAGRLSGSAMSVDKLPEEINEMKIRDDKVECLILTSYSVAVPLKRYLLFLSDG